MSGSRSELSIEQEVKSVSPESNRCIINARVAKGTVDFTNAWIVQNSRAPMREEQAGIFGKKCEIRWLEFESSAM